MPGGDPRRPSDGPSSLLRLRAWAGASPARFALAQGVVFGVLFGVFQVATKHDFVWAGIENTVLAAVLYGLWMWAMGRYLRRRRS